MTGVFVVALLSSAGGGLLRDAVFLQQIPSFLIDPIYLPLVAAATLFMTLFTSTLTQVVKAETIQKLVDVIDALGTPAFAVMGMQMAEDRGLPIFGVLFVGVVNGLAGGWLRDVVVRDVPALLRPGQFVSLMLVMAGGLFLTLTIPYHVNPTRAAWATVGGFFVLRLVAVRFNWQTRSVLGEPGDLEQAAKAPTDG